MVTNRSARIVANLSTDLEILEINEKEKSNEENNVQMRID